MSLETIQKVADAEARGKKQLAEARAGAKQLIANAEAAGHASQAECASLQEQARVRLDAAIDYFVGKVVNR